MTAKNSVVRAKLCAFSLGIAIGVTCALYMLISGWVAMRWGYGAPAIHDLARIYYGYAPTFIGGLWGALWGFIHGFIFGLIVGGIYNLCICAKCKK